MTAHDFLDQSIVIAAGVEQRRDPFRFLLRKVTDLNDTSH
jgi:hypothetical protein